jgi:hypothetical protein
MALRWAVKRPGKPAYWKYAAAKKSNRRAPFRRSYGKKRTYRKRRSMPRKAILNLTSRKKRNTMFGWSNTNDAGNRIPTVQRGATIQGATGYRGLWVATAQDLTDSTGVLGRSAEEAVRTSTSCFMRGLSEHIRIQTNTNIPWFWRRICFTYKGPDFYTFSPSDSPLDTNSRYLDTSAGIQRLLFNENVNAQSNTINNHDSIIFKGAKGVDWNDYMIAPLDTRRITVKYDKTMVFQTGNDKGILREFKQWFPMNHNVVYGDDESGDGETTSYVSTANKAGMGDYFVVDFINTGLGGATTDLMNFQANSTLYWHEK